MDINLDDLFDDKFSSPFIANDVEELRIKSLNAISEALHGSDESFNQEAFKEAMSTIHEEPVVETHSQMMNRLMSTNSSEMITPKVNKPKLTLETVFADMELMDEEYPEDIELSVGMLEGTIVETFEKAQDVIYSGEVTTPTEVVNVTMIDTDGSVVMQDEPVVLDTPLNAAMNELKSEETAYEESETTADEMRKEIKAMQAQLDAKKAAYTKVMDTRAEKRDVIYNLKSRVTREAHAEAERLKELEIKAKRKESMLSFHNDIKELNPEWAPYAYDHQWEGASTLALHGSALLADDMGLGKTLSAIMWLDMIKAKNVLVVTPNDTNSNFTMELGMWAKHRFIYPLAGASKETRDVMMDAILMPRIEQGKDLTLSLNFEQLYSDTEYFERLMSVKWDAIIIDEAHNFKNQKSLLFRRLLALKTSNMVEGKSVVKVLPMTGTFILNSPDDIWPALHLIDPDAFQTIKDFRDYYCQYNYDSGKWVFRPGGERSMLIHLGGRIVKRTMREAGINLPKQHVHEVSLSFNGQYQDQQDVMKQLALHSQIILDSSRKTSIVEQIALITRQRQCAVFPAGIVIKYPLDYEDQELAGTVAFSVGDKVTESIKIDWTIAKVKQLRLPTEEFPKGQRIAIFSQFKTALAEVEARLTAAGIKAVRYDGDTDQLTKMVVKRDFDRKHVEVGGGAYEYDVVLCNYKTGGVGLNFTHATQTILLDREWNGGKEDQAKARTNRIGQTQENHVWIPTLENSIDSWMNGLVESKRDLVAGLDSEIDLQKEFSNFLEVMKG